MQELLQLVRQLVRPHRTHAVEDRLVAGKIGIGRVNRGTVKVGQDVTARVIKIDKEDRRIGLSIKAANYDAERLQAEISSYDRIKGPSTGGAPAPSAGGSSSSSSGSGDFNSLGDLLDKAGN